MGYKLEQNKNMKLTIPYYLHKAGAGFPSPATDYIEEDIDLNMHLIKNGNMTMQFYLPSKFNLTNTPKPSNSEIKVLTIEGGYYAVIKYSGRSSDQNFLKNKDILEKQLKQDNICLLYTSPSPRDSDSSRMPSSA